ncbi:MAG: PilZ domain-containing protein [Fimbriimonadaceae bacterium]
MSVANRGIPTMTDASLFLQTRARLQRLADMKFFAGWVESINLAQVRIRLKASKMTVASGDSFSVEIAGKEQTAAFIGEVVGVLGSVITLALPRGLALMPKKENARVSVVGVLGRVRFEGAEYAVTIVDISENGLGVLANSTLERGAIVEFEIFTPIGTIGGAGEVRYSRVDPDSPKQFRAGIQLGDLDRIERARWTKLLNSMV